MNATTMTTAPHTITATDQVFATLEAGGKVLVRISAAGFTSIDDVVRLVWRKAGEILGLARISVRNKTQGWRTVATMTRRPAARPAAQPPHEGRQYLIPW